MSKVKDEIFIVNRDYSLEFRLLKFFIVVEECWAIFNVIMSIIFRLPKANIYMYVVVAIFFPLFFVVLHYAPDKNLMLTIYSIIYFISNPFVWYFAGGNKASANVLFICEIIVFAMCLSGKRQKIFIVLSVLSSSAVSAISAMPFFHELVFTSRQQSAASRNLGLSSSLMIVALLIKQKMEYARERDIAINSEKELEQSNKLQKNFLANMSHEIRSPLGIVLGFNGLIMESDDVNQIHEFSHNIDNAGKTLQTVINDILDYSKIESGKLDIIDADYSFKELISEVKNDIGLKCDEKGLKFNVRVSEDIPDNLYGDNIRIKQCMLNVLSNAVKYTDQGSVTLRVNSEKVANDDTIKITMSVIDTGHGIPKETLPNIFDAFQRLDEGHNRGIEGTGLGLAITKNLLDEMNGTINVQSEYGKGSIFTICINQKISGNKASVITGTAENISLMGLKVLAVDDTKLNLSLIQKLLIKEKIDVTTLDNGADCIEECKKNKYDVILLDHMMPEMDGVETFNRLRNDDDNLNKSTPVIMLTANAMVGAQKDYMDLGFDAYVSKPISIENLRDSINAVIANK